MGSPLATRIGAAARAPAKASPRAGLRRGGRQAEVLRAATTSAGTAGGKLVTAAQTQGSSGLPAIDSRGTPREEDSRGGKSVASFDYDESPAGAWSEVSRRGEIWRGAENSRGT